MVEISHLFSLPYSPPLLPFASFQTQNTVCSVRMRLAPCAAHCSLALESTEPLKTSNFLAGEGQNMNTILLTDHDHPLSTSA